MPVANAPGKVRRTTQAVESTPPLSARGRMPHMPPSPRIAVVQGDITRLPVDAIVNAANERLLGGGGVDGAVHRAAGPDLLDECRRIPEVRPGVRCPTGEARLTAGHNLPARHVIHTVGPVWHGGAHDEGALLANCYRNSLQLAVDHGLKTLAFPAISTGVYAFPLPRATRIAVHETRAVLATHPQIEQVTFVCFGDAALAAYRSETQAADQG
jgi:O-acetyl-ADP-ribose deacetylase (regulator of RNase III)